VREVQVKARTQVFQNTKLRVLKDHVTDGEHEVLDFMVVEPVVLRDDRIGGIAVVPIIDDHVVLIPMYRHALGRTALEVPRGFVDRGESPAEAASRELAEEAALDCPASRMISLGFCAPEPGIIAARIALFAAPDCTPCAPRPDQDMGRGANVRVPVSEVPAMLREAAIECAASSLALHRWMLR